MTRPSSQPMNRSELYRWVMALGFCAYDMLLYLDTHPDDAQALSYYNQCNELYNSAKKTYEERFEPLSAFGSQPLEDWDWKQTAAPGNGWNSHSHGSRKEGADSLCGIMKKDCNIRFPFQHQMLRWHLLL